MECYIITCEVMVIQSNLLMCLLHKQTNELNKKQGTHEHVLFLMGKVL